jgi:hypothetical protein
VGYTWLQLGRAGQADMGAVSGNVGDSRAGDKKEKQLYFFKSLGAKPQVPIASEKTRVIT